MSMLRLWLYAMVVPGVLGLAAMAAIVLPHGNDLTLTRLLAGCSAMITVQVVGGAVGGWLSAKEPTA